MVEGIRIDELPPTVVGAQLDHVVPVMRDGLTNRLTLAQILTLGRIATALADGTDLDTITSGGVYVVTSDVNAPVSGGRWIVRVTVDPSSAGTLLQEAYLLTGSSGALAFTRISAAGVFGAWSGGLSAADISFDDSTAFPGATNVQEALEESANYTGFVETQATLQDFVYGLVVSNRPDTDPDNDIVVGPGQARGNGVTVTNASSMIKRLDAAWSAGNNNGGLDTGSKANSTWYYVHPIRNNSTGAFDALMSLSATAPTVPSGWTRASAEPIGVIRTNSSGAILQFRFDRAHGGTYWFKDRIIETVPTIGTTASLVTVTVPPNATGIFATHATGAAAAFISITSTYETDTAVGADFFTLAHAANAFDASDTNVLVDGSSQLRVRASAESQTVRIMTRGFIFPTNRI